MDKDSKLYKIYKFLKPTSIDLLILSAFLILPVLLEAGFGIYIINIYRMGETLIMVSTILDTLGLAGVIITFIIELFTNYEGDGN